MKSRLVPLVVLGFTSIVSSSALAQSAEAVRLGEATDVLNELLRAEDSGIPRSILDRVEAVAVFPGVIRGAFIVGGQRGRGVISTRDPETEEWSLPAFLTLTGASFGFQIGGQAIDVVLLVVNRRGLDQFLSNQFKIGADVSVAAGPYGRNAQAATDIQLRAEILAYSRARGLFAGISLDGSAVQQDRDANERFYGYPYRTQDLVLKSTVSPPPETDTLTRWREWLAEHLAVGVSPAG